jgi:hypothetical protein
VTVPSLLILGTDAVLAASPATPVQLVHACLAVGYQAVIPASWGDELIAARVLERLRETDLPVLQCSCPLVARRLATHGASLAPSVVTVAAPPVATAKYLRALYAPVRPYITYVGACAAANHEAIDVWLNPDALAGALAERGISPLTQPTEFDSILPPDRRRFFSDPGGVPSRLALRELSEEVGIVEPITEDIAAEVAQLLLSGSRILIDVALSQGCACSGVKSGVAAGIARATAKASEPPRALGPVVDHELPLLLEAVSAAPSLPASDAPVAFRIADAAAEKRSEAIEPRSFSDDAGPRRIPSPASPVLVDDRASPVAIASETLEAPPVVEAAGRVSAGSVRAVLGSIPQSRTDAGRQLPRAYIARRRSTPRGVRTSAATGGRRPSGPIHRPLSRWLIATAVVIGTGLLAGWLLLLSSR